MTENFSKGDATRRRLSESMLELIQTRGYHGAGLTAVLEHSAAPKGSLYFHFPGGKSELGESAIALTAEQFRASLAHAATRSSSVAELVDTIISQLAALLVSTDFRQGCPVAAVTLDTGSDDDRLRSACGDAYSSWADELGAFLAAIAPATVDTQGAALSAVCLIEGALIVSRAQRSIAPLEAASTSLLTLLGTLVDPGESR